MAYYLRNAANNLRTFDQAFEPRQSGDPVSSVGTPYNNSSGQDIINDYVPLSFGGSQIDADSHYHADNNDDLRLIFAAKGSVGRLAAPWSGETYTETNGCESLSPCTPASSQIRLRIDEDRSFYAIRDLSESNRGRWLLNDSRPASDFEARVTGTVFSRNDYQNWATISDTRLVISEDAPSGPIGPGGSETTDFPATIEIRDKSNTGNSVTGACTLRHTFRNIT